MTILFGQGLFNLSAHSGHRPTVPFEKAKPVPQSDDLSLSGGVHASKEQIGNRKASR
jgi:hypothetical protein